MRIQPDRVMVPPDLLRVPWGPEFLPVVEGGFPAYPVLFRDGVAAGNGVLVSLDGATYLVTSPSVIGPSPASLIDARFDGPRRWTIEDMPQPWFVRHPSLPGLVGIRLTSQEAARLSAAGVQPWPLGGGTPPPVGSVLGTLSRDASGRFDLRTWLAFLSGREGQQLISMLPGAVGPDGLAAPSFDANGRLVGIASRSESDGCWTEQTLVSGPEVAGLLRRDLLINGQSVPYWMDRDRYLELMRYLASKGYSVVTEAGGCSMQGGRGGFACEADGRGFPSTAIAAISASPTDDLSLSTSGTAGGDVPNAGFAVLEVPPGSDRQVEVASRDLRSNAPVMYLHVIPAGSPPKPAPIVVVETPRPTPPIIDPVPTPPTPTPIPPPPPPPPPPATLRVDWKQPAPTWTLGSDPCTIRIAVPLDEVFTDEVRQSMGLDVADIRDPDAGTSVQAALIRPNSGREIRLPVRGGRVWILMSNPPGVPMPEEASSANIRSDVQPEGWCSLSSDARRVQLNGEDFDLWELVIESLSQKGSLTLEGGELREGSCEIRPFIVESLVGR